MKKTFLIAALALTAVGSYAQKLRFGATAGTTFATQKLSFEGINITGSSKVGITLGATADIELTDNIYIQPGLNFTQKNSSLSFLGETGTININYLEIPINAFYNTKIGNGKLFAGAGPSLGFGVSGKTKSGGKSNDIKFGSGDNADLKSFDFGLNLAAGYEFSQGITVGINYNLGLSNLTPVSEGGASQKINYFGIRVGYKFGGK